MENSLIQIASSVPALIKNTHLNVSLQGWPAAVTAVSLFGSCVIIYAIWAHHSEVLYAREGCYTE